MVYLNKIYTRTGDAGETSLGDGTRVAKSHPRIAAYGTVDELNSFLGVVNACQQLHNRETQRLSVIQNDLFDVGADLCVPETDMPNSDEALRVVPQQTEQLEQWIDEYTQSQAPLTSFVLPGGSLASAHLHVARTVCRRAEIAVQVLMETEAINSQVPIYLNRLSDLLFVLARLANDNGRADVLWVPGGQR